MFARRLTPLALAIFALSTGLAQAQSTTTDISVRSSRVADTIGRAFTAVTSEEAVVAQSSVGSGPYTPRLFGGIVTGTGNTGFVIGGGLSARPFVQEEHEIQGNVSFLRLADTNGFIIDANYVYNFDTGGSVTPYAGAGLNVSHLAITETALQIGGGISNQRVFGEIWFVIDTGNPVVIRGGLRW
jgi:hypothetical protein